MRSKVRLPTITMFASSEAVALQLGKGETFKIAGALFTDISTFCGIWMPLLLELGDLSVALGERCGAMGVLGHVAVTIEPGGPVTMTMFCGLMVLKSSPEAGHAMLHGGSVRGIASGDVGIGGQKTAAMRAATVQRL
mmetsp:Transcript_94007/g.186391  ORF Transcript_94007/g.186391 Transcript_94007/m.186391 type:complete len:137 (+) Transcript_94007:1587-1997(+)